MSTNYFAPTIWSETLIQLLKKEYVAVNHCTRDFEGEIRECGDTVRIIGVNPVTIGDYVKNTDLPTPAVISQSMRELVIDQAKYFNFLIDDIDRAQNCPDVMQRAMQVAAEGLKNEADKCVFNVCKNATVKIEQNATAENILDAILEARTKLMIIGLPADTEIYLEVSPEIAKLIFKAKTALSTDNNTILENGYLGSIYGCKIYVSSNIPGVKSGDEQTFNCFMRTKNAVAFAEQLSEIDAYRPENRFADAVKGLHLYGAKIIEPDQIVQLNLTVPTVA